MIIDVHAHLFDGAFDNDRGAVIERAKRCGVTTILNNGLDHETNQAAISLQNSHAVCGAASGVHPGHLAETSGDELAKIYQQMRRPDVIAVGEIGLDYGYAESDAQRERQRNVFEESLRIADEEGKPAIIHSRNAEGDVLDILDDVDPLAAVLHAFTGRRNQWRQALQNGVYFSIPPIAHRADQFKELIKDAKTHLLLTETDSPHLPRVAGERNEPYEAAEVIDLLSDIKGVDMGGVVATNYHRIFDKTLRRTSQPT